MISFILAWFIQPVPFGSDQIRNRCNAGEIAQERRVPAREGVITIDIIARGGFLFSHGEEQTSEIGHAS